MTKNEERKRRSTFVGSNNSRIYRRRYNDTARIATALMFLVQATFGCEIPNCKICDPTKPTAYCEMCKRGYKKVIDFNDGLGKTFNTCVSQSDKFWLSVFLVGVILLSVGFIVWLVLVRFFINSPNAVKAREEKIKHQKKIEEFGKNADHVEAEKTRKRRFRRRNSPNHRQEGRRKPKLRIFDKKKKNHFSKYRESPEDVERPEEPKMLPSKVDSATSLEDHAKIQGNALILFPTPQSQNQPENSPKSPEEQPRGLNDNTMKSFSPDNEQIYPKNPNLHQNAFPEIFPKQVYSNLQSRNDLGDQGLQSSPYKPQGGRYPKYHQNPYVRNRVQKTIKDPQRGENKPRATFEATPGTPRVIKEHKLMKSRPPKLERSFTLGRENEPKKDLRTSSPDLSDSKEPSLAILEQGFIFSSTKKSSKRNNLPVSISAQKPESGANNALKRSQVSIEETAMRPEMSNFELKPIKMQKKSDLAIPTQITKYLPKTPKEVKDDNKGSESAQKPQDPFPNQPLSPTFKDPRNLISIGRQAARRDKKQRAAGKRGPNESILLESIPPKSLDEIPPFVSLKNTINTFGAPSDGIESKLDSRSQKTSGDDLKRRFLGKNSGASGRVEDVIEVDKKGAGLPEDPINSSNPLMKVSRGVRGLSNPILMMSNYGLVKKGGLPGRGKMVGIPGSKMNSGAGIDPESPKSGKIGVGVDKRIIKYIAPKKDRIDEDGVKGLQKISRIIKKPNFESSGIPPLLTPISPKSDGFNRENINPNKRHFFTKKITNKNAETSKEIAEKVKNGQNKKTILCRVKAKGMSQQQHELTNPSPKHNHSLKTIINKLQNPSKMEKIAEIKNNPKPENSLQRMRNRSKINPFHRRNQPLSQNSLQSIQTPRKNQLRGNVHQHPDQPPNSAFHAVFSGSKPRLSLQTIQSTGKKPQRLVSTNQTNFVNLGNRHPIRVNGTPQRGYYSQQAVPTPLRRAINHPVVGNGMRPIYPNFGSNQQHRLVNQPRVHPQSLQVIAMPYRKPFGAPQRLHSQQSYNLHPVTQINNFRPNPLQNIIQQPLIHPGNPQGSVTVKVEVKSGQKPRTSQRAKIDNSGEKDGDGKQSWTDLRRISPMKANRGLSLEYGKKKTWFNRNLEQREREVSGGGEGDEKGKEASEMAFGRARAGRSNQQSDRTQLKRLLFNRGSVGNNHHIKRQSLDDGLKEDVESQESQENSQKTHQNLGKSKTEVLSKSGENGKIREIRRPSLGPVGKNRVGYSSIADSEVNNSYKYAGKKKSRKIVKRDLGGSLEEDKPASSSAPRSEGNSLNSKVSGCSEPARKYTKMI